MLLRLVRTILDCRTEFLLSRADEKANAIDRAHFKELQKLIQHRIDLINLAANPVNTLDFLSEKEVVELVFEFIKVRTVILDMKNVKAPEPIKIKVQSLTHEVKRMKNHDDEEVIKLDEFLRKTFEKLSFNNADDLSALDAELQDAIDKARKINEENEKLAAEFNGEFAYVKTYQDMCKNHPDFNKDDVLKFIKILAEAVAGIKSVNTLVLLGRTNFIANIKKQTSGRLLKEGLYSRLRLAELFDSILGNLFVNLQLY